MIDKQHKEISQYEIPNQNRKKHQTCVNMVLLITFTRKYFGTTNLKFDVCFNDISVRLLFNPISIRLRSERQRINISTSYLRDISTPLVGVPTSSVEISPK